MSIRACAAMCGATTEGLEVESTEFTFVPGPRIACGTYVWNIGTAGSTTMLAFSVLPLACFADGAVRARIEGGVFQDFAPSRYHFQHALAVLRRRMGVVAHVEVTRPGYVPGGAGVIELRVTPAPENVQSLTLVAPGEVDDTTANHAGGSLTDQRPAGLAGLGRGEPCRPWDSDGVWGHRTTRAPRAAWEPR